MMILLQVLKNVKGGASKQISKALVNAKRNRLLNSAFFLSKNNASDSPKEWVNIPMPPFL